MKQQDVFKKIGGILKELNEQYEYLETIEGQLNDLELELFVANAHFLTDHTEILRKLNALAGDKKTVTKIEPEVTLTSTPPLAASVSEAIPFKPEVNHYEQKHFEPVVQKVMPQAPPVKPAAPEVTEERSTPAKPIEFEITPSYTEEDSPAGSLDLEPEHTEDTFTFIRQEPETIRHELTLDESVNWEDEEDQESAEQEDLDDEIIELPEDPELDRRPVYTNTLREQEEVESTPSMHEREIVPEPESEPTPEPQSAPEPVQEPDPVTEVTEPEPVKQREPKASISGATEATNEEPLLTINQRMSAQLNANKSTEPSVGLPPIKDLKSAINLNDKLLYVKDLFNGYSLAYSEAIEILNRFNTFEEADRFLKANYTTKNNWESKQSTADKFYTILRRRYA